VRPVDTRYGMSNGSARNCEVCCPLGFAPAAEGFDGDQLYTRLRVSPMSVARSLSDRRSVTRNGGRQAGRWTERLRRESVAWSGIGVTARFVQNRTLTLSTPFHKYGDVFSGDS
jgi:hypothetical protein